MVVRFVGNTMCESFVYEMDSYNCGQRKLSGSSSQSSI